MRLAIVIEGKPNSGKTSTIKELVNVNKDKDQSITRIRQGWQRLVLNKNFQYLKLDAYCVPSSPSETGIELQKRFQEGVPDVLIVAIQTPEGQYHLSSLKFLSSNNYTILRYEIKNDEGSSDWNRFDNSTKSTKLSKRAKKIINDIKEFIKDNRLI